MASKEESAEMNRRENEGGKSALWRHNEVKVIQNEYDVSKAASLEGITLTFLQGRL